MPQPSEFHRWSPSADDLKSLTPVRCRDLIVRCFFEAQKETFISAKKELGFSTQEEDIRKSVENVVRMAFNASHGDFDFPTKESLINAVDILASKASSWGTPGDIINHHKIQIQKALGALA